MRYAVSYVYLGDNTLSITFVEADSEVEAAVERLNQAGWEVSPEDFADLDGVKEWAWDADMLIEVVEVPPQEEEGDEL